VVFAGAAGGAIGHAGILDPFWTRAPLCLCPFVHDRLSNGRPYERFNGTLRREVLNTEWFASTRQAQTVVNQRLRQYNHIRQHHALGMRPPVPETFLVNHQINGTDQGG
jgi:hypothetical protein